MAEASTPPCPSPLPPSRIDCCSCQCIVPSVAYAMAKSTEAATERAGSRSRGPPAAADAVLSTDETAPHLTAPGGHVTGNGDWGDGPSTSDPCVRCQHCCWRSEGMVTSHLPVLRSRVMTPLVQFRCRRATVKPAIQSPVGTPAGLQAAPQTPAPQPARAGWGAGAQGSTTMAERLRQLNSDVPTKQNAGSAPVAAAVGPPPGAPPQQQPQSVANHNHVQVMLALAILQPAPTCGMVLNLHKPAPDVLLASSVHLHANGGFVVQANVGAGSPVSIPPSLRAVGAPVSAPPAPVTGGDWDGSAPPSSAAVGPAGSLAPGGASGPLDPQACLLLPPVRWTAHQIQQARWLALLHSGSVRLLHVATKFKDMMQSWSSSASRSGTATRPSVEATPCCNPRPAGGVGEATSLCKCVA
jgi:hypothetical protein